MVQQRASGAKRNQAIISIDEAAWKMFVRAYDLTEPLIPHRVHEQTEVAEGAWYA